MSKNNPGPSSPELCHVCGGASLCTDSRLHDDYRRRRYRCRSDGSHRWTTYETRAVPSSVQASTTRRDILRAVRLAITEAERVKP